MSQGGSQGTCCLGMLWCILLSIWVITTYGCLVLFLCHVPGGPGLLSVDSFPIVCSTLTPSSPSAVSTATPAPLGMCYSPWVLSRSSVIFRHPISLLFVPYSLFTLLMCPQPCGGSLPGTAPQSLFLFLPSALCLGFFPEDIVLHGDVNFFHVSQNWQWGSWEPELIPVV